MLRLAFKSLRRTGESSWSIGNVSDNPDSYYLWHYWMPSIGMLNPECFQLISADEALAGGHKFIYPLDLRWEFIEFFGEGKIRDPFLAPHIPPEVLDAVRRGSLSYFFFSVRRGARRHSEKNPENFFILMI